MAKEDGIFTSVEIERNMLLSEPGWGEKVTIVLHHVPEDEGSEGGFEAVTMTGVPHEVTVKGSDPNSAEGAVEHLLAGLNAFGFSGRVAVEDATMDGRIERYDIHAG